MCDYLHVVPLDDFREHAVSRDCWCCPTEDEEDPFLIIHHSMDGRERYSRGELLPN